MIDEDNGGYFLFYLLNFFLFINMLSIPLPLDKQEQWAAGKVLVPMYLTQDSPAEVRV